MIPLPAHIGKSQMKTAFHIFLPGDFHTGAELVEDIAEIRIIDGGFALDYGIVMIQNQTGIF
jgi:5-methylthioribose kinase